MASRNRFVSRCALPPTYWQTSGGSVSGFARTDACLKSAAFTALSFRFTTAIIYRLLFPPMNFSIPILSILIGVVILLFGRKLFWLCVAAIGFAAGVELAPHLAQDPSALLSLTIALLLGIIGALLALFLQKIAIAVLGFLAGGKLAGAIAAAFFVHYAQHSTIIFVIGGVIGALLLLVLFDWALIVVSSLIGAHLLVYQSTIALPQSGSIILVIGLSVVGILVQAASLRRSGATIA